MWQELKRLLLDIFYPRSCPGCGTQVQEEGLLCPACRAGLLEPRTVVPESVGCRHLDGLFFSFIMKGASGKGCTRPSLGAAGKCWRRWPMSGPGGWSRRRC